jgi:hypothetical protein
MAAPEIISASDARTMTSAKVWEHLQNNMRLRDQCLCDVGKAILGAINSTPPEKKARYTFPENCDQYVVENVCLNMWQTYGYKFELDRAEYMLIGTKTYSINWMEE